MKLDQVISIEGQLTSINELVEEAFAGRQDITITVNVEAPYRVRLFEEGSEGFYQWSVSKYAALSLAQRGVRIERIEPATV